MKNSGSFSARQGFFVASLVVSFVAEFCRPFDEAYDEAYDEVWEVVMRHATSLGGISLTPACQDVPHSAHFSGSAHSWPTSRKPRGPRLPYSNGSCVASIQC